MEIFTSEHSYRERFRQGRVRYVYLVRTPFQLAPFYRPFLFYDGSPFPTAPPLVGRSDSRTAVPVHSTPRALHPLCVSPPFCSSALVRPETVPYGDLDNFDMRKRDASTCC